MPIEPRKCVVCGKEFVPKHNRGKAKLCSEECRKKYNNEKSVRLYHKKMRLKRQKRAAEEKARKMGRIIPLPIITAEIAAYNKAHGTNISYGKYVMMKERGMLDNGN